MAFIMNPSNGQSIAGSEQVAKQMWADHTFLANPDLNSFLTPSFAQNEIANPNKPKAFLVWLFFTKKDFKFLPEVSGLLPATDANQLGDLGIMNLKMPDNGYLYVYLTNQSAQIVDFENLTII